MVFGQVFEPSDLTFNSIKSIGVKTYSWFFKDQMIQTGQQLSITGSATTDDGVYTCVATNSLGIRQANMDANVRCKFYIYISLCTCSKQQL
jgi:hypothetical protein